MQLPEDFVRDTKPLLGNEWNDFVTALTSLSPVSIRLNPVKAAGLELDLPKVAWSDNGYYLPSRPAFTFDPLFHAGTYYVQEASSMFIEQVFRKYYSEKDIKVLDLCAAPGGKSTHIASLISKNSLLVSNEVIRNRANILSENITKAGYPNTIVTNNDSAEIGNMESFFDVVLVDAPCSGEGMFRKDNDAIKEWSLSNVKLCMERQRRILSDVWNALKPDGILIYSTCTYNRNENEDNVLWVRDNLDAEILDIQPMDEWNISRSYDKDIPAYHFFPHKIKGEGFFISVLRKKKQDNPTKKFKPSKNKASQKKNGSNLSEEYKNYINHPEQFTFFEKNNSWFAFPENFYVDFLQISSVLKLVTAGIYIGETKGKSFIPHHSLAMSNSLNRNSFICHETDWQTAIHYLRRDNIFLPDLPSGYILLTYKNHPLGFVKNIGNRVNNLYPNEWRIRSNQIPDSFSGFI